MEVISDCDGETNGQRQGFIATSLVYYDIWNGWIYDPDLSSFCFRYMEASTFT